MGMPPTPGAGSDNDESIRTIRRAIDLRVTLIDTAEVYGPYTASGDHHNEAQMQLLER